MKRILLFLATNLAIVLALSVTLHLPGVEPYLNEQSLNLKALLIFAAVMGFGGSFISPAISGWMVKKSMGMQVIEAQSNSTEFCILSVGNHPQIFRRGRNLQFARHQCARDWECRPAADQRESIPTKPVSIRSSHAWR